MAYDRVYTNKNVFDAGLDRIRWIYDHFKHVVVSFSGGKDSTICLQLALIVAEEKKRLPVQVMFIDQETEWQSVIDYMRIVMYDPRVRPSWLQVPFKMYNATSPNEEFLHAWAEGAKWMRDKEPISIKRNVYGVDRFKPMFGAWSRYHYGTKPLAALAGMRCEESPGRTLVLTANEVGKYPPQDGYPVTWGWNQNSGKKHYVFSPIYDWTTRDVWKAIHDNNWPYTKLYDLQYQYGIPVKQMRVSSVHHVLALRSLWYLQELEPQTWERLQARLGGVHAAATLRSRFNSMHILPLAFTSWREYRDYLFEHILQERHQVYFTKMFARYDKLYEGSPQALLDDMYHAQVSAMLRYDTYGVVMGTWTVTHRPPKLIAKWKAERADREDRVRDQMQDVVAEVLPDFEEDAEAEDAAAPF